MFGDFKKSFKNVYTLCIVEKSRITHGRVKTGLLVQNVG